jgi:hypothetical protein
MHAGTVRGLAGAWDTEAPGRNQTTRLYCVRPTMVRFLSLTAAAFAARVSVAQEQTRVLQEEYNLEGDAYMVALGEITVGCKHSRKMQSALHHTITENALNSLLLRLYEILFSSVDLSLC